MIDTTQDVQTVRYWRNLSKQRVATSQIRVQRAQPFTSASSRSCAAWHWTAAGGSASYSTTATGSCFVVVEQGCVLDLSHSSYKIQIITDPSRLQTAAGCGEGDRRCVRLAYQPPASNTFLSQQTSHQQPASSTVLSQQTSTSHQPLVKRTG
jgi:hypothetical protein